MFTMDMSVHIIIDKKLYIEKWKNETYISKELRKKILRAILHKGCFIHPLPPSLPFNMS